MKVVRSNVDGVIDSIVIRETTNKYVRCETIIKRIKSLPDGRWYADVVCPFCVSHVNRDGTVAKRASKTIHRIEMVSKDDLSVNKKCCNPYHIPKCFTDSESDYYLFNQSNPADMAEIFAVRDKDTEFVDKKTPDNVLRSQQKYYQRKSQKSSDV